MGVVVLGVVLAIRFRCVEDGVTCSISDGIEGDEEEEGEEEVVVVVVESPNDDDEAVLLLLLLQSSSNASSSRANSRRCASPHPIAASR